MRRAGVWGVAMRVDTVVGQLSVELVGEGSAALLWHSLFVDATQWARVRDVLGAHRMLVLVDGPGHGSSGPPPRRFTLSDCADAGRQVLDALSLPAVDWVGTAWGGHVGILFAARHPEHCRTLAAIAAPIQPLSAGERARIGSLVVAYRLVGPVRPLTRPWSTRCWVRRASRTRSWWTSFEPRSLRPIAVG